MTRKLRSGVTEAMQLRAKRVWRHLTASPKAVRVIWMSRLEARTRHTPSHVTSAQARILAAMLPGLSLTAPIAWFWICRSPTLPAGRLNAAYDVPPNAMNKAIYATTLPRR